MSRTIIKLLSQVLIVLGPMFTLNWSFVDYLGREVSPASQTSPALWTMSLWFFSFNGPKPSVELKLRLLISALALIPLIILEVKDTIIPQRELREFRTVYLAEQKQAWRDLEPDNKIPEDVRINIMHVRYPWYTFGLFGKFYWTWNDGFSEPPNQDANMYLLTFQGVAGIVYRKRDTKALGIDLRDLPPRTARVSDYRKSILIALLVAAVITLLLGLVGLSLWIQLPISMIAGFLCFLVGSALADPYHMWPWQINRTKHVKFILSIPLFRASKGDSQSFKRVGVINLDTHTDAGSDFLEENYDLLVDLFADRGKVIAYLR
jgi:hypothetical protein